MSRRLAVLMAGVLALAGLLALVSANSPSAQPRVYRIGLINLGGPYAQVVDGLREGLQ